MVVVGGMGFALTKCQGFVTKSNNKKGNKVRVRGCVKSRYRLGAGAKKA